MTSTELTEAARHLEELAHQAGDGEAEGGEPIPWEEAKRILDQLEAVEMAGDTATASKSAPASAARR